MEAYQFFVYALGYIGLFATSFYILNLFLYYKKRNISLEESDKTVTIIIPAYNEEKSIEKTIESALSIDYPPHKLDIVVVDDGSTDKTLELARKYEGESRKFKVRVFHKENGGKGTALNLGISKSDKDIIVSMDADSFVSPKALKKMIAHFYKDSVMAVTPAMGIYKPKGIWQRVQHIEYYMGVFLRKCFGAMNAIHITPGAFSAYRREFFLKHGGYDENNITEDLEIALRIQSHNYVIENAQNAAVYTIGPKKFKELLVQRNRWYTGLIRNMWAYRRLYGFKGGAMGMVVLPVAATTIVLALILTIYVFFRVLNGLKNEIVFLNSINFQFQDLFQTNMYFLKTFISNFFLSIFTNPVILISLFFITLLYFYLSFARKNMEFHDRIKLNLIIFVIFFSALFAFWWMVSIFYVIFDKEVVWKIRKNEKKN